MNNNGKTNGKYWLGALSILVIVAIAVFGFSFQRSTEAYEMGIQNRERIAVMESKMDKLTETLDEVRSDIKILLRNYPR